MAIFEVVNGSPGQGKSLYTARKTRALAYRNERWHKKGNDKREIWSNIKFSKEFEDRYKDYIRYWTSTNELVGLRNVDIIWDEIATELDARNWINLTDEIKRFLSQYRKRGIDIYANTQDFSMVDKRARIMINSVLQLTKVIGSRDPSPTKPPIKNIWGLVMIRRVRNYRIADLEKYEYEPLPSFFTIKEADVNLYDTTQDIERGELPPLTHEVRVCEIHGKGCDFKKIVHY